MVFVVDSWFGGVVFFGISVIVLAGECVCVGVCVY